MMSEENKECLTLSEMTKWIVDDKSNDQELGERLRRYYWKFRTIDQNIL